LKPASRAKTGEEIVVEAIAAAVVASLSLFLGQRFLIR